MCWPSLRKKSKRSEIRLRHDSQGRVRFLVLRPNGRKLPPRLLQVGAFFVLEMLSGQAPTPDTTDDCLPGLTGSIGNFNDVIQTGTTPDGQVIASGGWRLRPGAAGAVCSTTHAWKARKAGFFSRNLPLFERDITTG